jgi:hypothetical protein
MPSKIRILPISTPLNQAQKEFAVNATSRGTGWERGLSPFFVGPIPLLNGEVATNLENAWQFSKAYREHVSPSGTILPAYWEWARKGWADNHAHRYPMGRGAVPLFALGKDENDRLDYIQSRKRLYGPLYLEAVKKTEAYAQLETLWNAAQENGQDLIILDFDAYDHHALGMSLQDVVNNPRRKAGHGFFLAMNLTGETNRCLS